jgi:hypothetical protein
MFLEYMSVEAPTLVCITNSADEKLLPIYIEHEYMQ